MSEAERIAWVVLLALSGAILVAPISPDILRGGVKGDNCKGNNITDKHVDGHKAKRNRKACKKRKSGASAGGQDWGGKLYLEKHGGVIRS